MVLRRVQKNGTIVIEDGEELAEGTVVEIRPIDDEGFEVSPEFEQELLDRSAAAARGETVSHDEYLERRRALREANQKSGKGHLRD